MRRSSGEKSVPTALERSLIRGVAWTGGIKWTSQILTWGSTLVVARFVPPSDYGIVGMATLYLGVVGLVGEFGLGAAVITMQKLNEEEIAQLGGAAVIFGLAAMLISWAMAWPIGWFFQSPAVPWVVMVMSTNCVISGLRTIPSALLQRDLDFKTVSLIELSQGLVSAAATLLLAVAGEGYWALALGSVVGGLVAAVAFMIRRPAPRAWPHWPLIREPLKYSAHILGGQLSWWVYSNADFMVAGRVLGSAALGAYGLAWEIANVPVERLTNVITKVTPAHFAALQHDRRALKRGLLTLTHGLALVTLPASLGMVLTADDFVRAALGHQWLAAVLPLQLLSAYAGVRSLVTLLPQILNVTGDSAMTVRMGLLFVTVMPLAFLFGSRWGPPGIAIMWVAVYPVLTIPFYWRTFLRLECSLAEYLGSLGLALRGCFLMGLAVVALDWALPVNFPPLASLAAKALLGALVYALTAIFPQRRRLLRLFRGLREGTGPLPAES
ncbi:MAG TPA: lipopolysaccharide biosynthesis protein [Gemmatimonadales bacterium]|nr:lipopolysaccharide biosynthesis protein [Gemmatimonadales bacterium]